MDRKWLLPLILSSAFSCLLLLLLTVALSSSSSSSFSAHQSNGLMPSLLSFLSIRDPDDLFIESKLTSHTSSSSAFMSASSATLSSFFSDPPRLAYAISGSKGDGIQMRRTLLALYHPRNQYVLHLDLEALSHERIDLIRFVKLHPTFSQVGNVHVITKSNLVTYKGPTMVASTLHAAAILLRKSKEWDWFINLSSSDYPLITQDDLLHVLSYLPRDLNFLDHTSNLGWKEYHRARPIIIDPGLYMSKKSDIFWATQKRGVPDAFKLFTGSAWMILTRPFIEYCIWGWDNLPRILLMYYTNFVSSPEGYFHTIICNSKEFSNTTVNHDMHYLKWDNPPKQHPHLLSLDDFQAMNDSCAPFARKFPRDDPILDKVDSELLGRKDGFLVPGGWCIGKGENLTDPCDVIGDTSLLKPGSGSRRLEHMILDLLSTKKFRANQCK